MNWNTVGTKSQYMMLLFLANIFLRSIFKRKKNVTESNKNYCDTCLEFFRSPNDTFLKAVGQKPFVLNWSTYLHTGCPIWIRWILKSYVLLHFWYETFFPNFLCWKRVYNVHFDIWNKKIFTYLCLTPKTRPQ